MPKVFPLGDDSGENVESALHHKEAHENVNRDCDGEEYHSIKNINKEGEEQEDVESHESNDRESDQDLCQLRRGSVTSEGRRGSVESDGSTAKGGSVLFIDIGTRVYTTEDGEEIVTSIAPLGAAVLLESDCSESDDGTSFLSPVMPISPVEEVPQVICGVQVLEEPTQFFRPRRTSLASGERKSSSTPFDFDNKTGSGKLRLPGVSSLSSFAGSSLANESLQGGFLGRNGSEASAAKSPSGGSLNYGNGSQVFVARPPRGRLLSFADEKGLDMQKVHETVETHYNKSDRDFCSKKKFVFMAIIGSIVVVVSLVGIAIVLIVSGNGSGSD